MTQSESIWKQVGKITTLVAACLLSTSVTSAIETNAYLTGAQEYIGQGDFNAAIIELKNALQQDPSNAEARQALGRIYLRTGDGNSAEKELNRAVALGLDSAELRLDLVEASIRQGRLDAARQHLEALPAGEEETRVRALTLRAMIELEMGQAETARASFERALELQPDAKQPAMGLIRLDIQAGEMADALVRTEAVLGDHPKDMEALLIKAGLLQKLGRLDEALQTLDTAIDVDDRNIRALLVRAEVNLARGRNEATVADLDRVEQLDPNVVMTKYLRAVLAFRGNRLEEARDNIQMVLSALPSHAPAQLLYGLIGYSMGDLELAEEFLGRIRPDMPGYRAAAKVLGATRIKLQQPERAIEVLQPLMQDQGEDLQLLLLLGSAYLMQGDHVRSAELLQKAVEMEPDVARYRTQLAMGLLAGGRTDEAVDQLKSAVEMETDLVQADILLVMTHIRKQELDEALQASQALERRLPDSPVPPNLTGLVYLARQDLGHAAQQFERALSLDPEFVTALTNLARIDLARKDLAAAERHYGQALEIQPDNVAALIGMAGIAEQAGNEQQMLQWLQNAVELNPARAEPAILLGRYYLSRKQPLKALAVANAAAARLPDDPGVLEVLARAQSAAGEPNNAVRTLQHLVEVAPRPGNYLLLATARVAIGDRANARLSLQEGLRLQPDFPVAQLTLASLVFEDGDAERALALVQEVQRQHPELDQPHRLEGAMRNKSGEHAAAMQAYQRAHALRKTAETARQLAKLYENAGRRDDAIAIMRDWLAHNPDDLSVRMMLAVSFQGWGRIPEAITEYEHVYQRNNTNPVLMNNLAWLYFMQKDPRALALAKQAYEDAPERPEIADTYGWILLKQAGDPGQALPLLQAAYVKSPTNAEIGFHVAVALHELGRNDEARRTLRRILNEGASFPQREEAERLRRTLER